jgi:hypothetical protein
MSISSIAPPPPLPPPPPVAAKAPDVNADRNDSRTAPPPVQAALPPGQGSRINIIA